MNTLYFPFQAFLRGKAPIWVGSAGFIAIHAVIAPQSKFFALWFRGRCVFRRYKLEMG